MSWTYPEELLDALVRLGFAPTSETPPLFVREAVDELYKHELRLARERLRAGDGERSGYAGRIVALRRKYWMLTLPRAAWAKIVPEDTAGAIKK